MPNGSNWQLKKYCSTWYLQFMFLSSTLLLFFFRFRVKNWIISSAVVDVLRVSLPVRALRSRDFLNMYNEQVEPY